MPPPSDSRHDPPPPVSTLLRTVRLRSLAARLGAESLQSEEGLIVLRLAKGLTFGTREQSCPMPDGVSVGRTLMRYRPRRADPNWMDVIEDALERLAAIEPAA